MLKLDIDKVRFKGQHNSVYNVKFKLLEKNKDAVSQSEWLKVSGKSCYSSVWYDLNGGKNKINKLATTFKTVETSVKLSIEEALHWLELCKIYKLLPDYIEPKKCVKPVIEKESRIDLFTCSFVLDLDENQSTIYMYLDTFRHLKEDPGFVKAILYMHDECKMDFYIAYVLSSHLNIVGTGHHTLPITNSVYSYNKPVPITMKDSLNLRVVRAFYKFLFDPTSYKDTKFLKSNHWRCNPLISELTKTDLLIPIPELNNPEVVKIAHELDNTVANELYKNYIEK